MWFGEPHQFPERGSDSACRNNKVTKGDRVDYLTVDMRHVIIHVWICHLFELLCLFVCVCVFTKGTSTVNCLHFAGEDFRVPYNVLTGTCFVCLNFDVTDTLFVSESRIKVAQSWNWRHRDLISERFQISFRFTNSCWLWGPTDSQF